MKKNLNRSLLRKIAYIVLLAGASGSLVSLIRTGHNNKSVLLSVLFIIWVLSPFLGLLAGLVFSRRRKIFNSIVFYFLLFAVTISSLNFYSGILGFHGPKPAFIFIVVPFFSWLLMAVVIILARSIMKKREQELH
jgi:hypothetical protein